MREDNKALLLVDLQNDFFPGNALGVPNAEAIFPLANQMQSYFDLVVASKDWHPPNHLSFARNHPGYHDFEIIQLKGLPQVLWPAHCVENTHGAEFHPKLETTHIKKIIYKGTDPEIDSYSAFFDNAHQKKTELDAYLRSQGVNTLYLLGLATDYCVQYTALDALKLGFKTFVILDGCFGINQQIGDIDKAIQNMKDAGANIIESQKILTEPFAK